MKDIYTKNKIKIKELIDLSKTKDINTQKVFDFYLVSALYRNKCLMDRGNVSFIRKNPITKEETDYIEFLCKIINAIEYEDLNIYDLKFYESILMKTKNQTDPVLAFIHREMVYQLTKIYNSFYNESNLKIGVSDKNQQWISQVEPILNKYK